MENKPFKTIVLKKEVVSNLNDNQMNVIWGGRAPSYETLHQEACDTVNICCTMFYDCGATKPPATFLAVTC